MLLFILGLCINLVNASQSTPVPLHLSSESQPKFSKEYYAEQSLKYFDTLDTTADRKSKPIYSKKVIRWEWYPWLKLTGYRKGGMKFDKLLLLYPTRVIDRDCQGYDVQPFGRCVVTFVYGNPNKPKKNKSFKIYEEFTFNDHGEMTFIEAWTFGDRINRLSTRVPGLGTEWGEINRKSEAFKLVAAQDGDVWELGRRLKHPVSFWLRELAHPRRLPSEK